MMITVIDDSATTVVILKSLSSKVAGAQATGFTDPVAAFQHLQEAPTDLVIVDYSMPNLTGVELIKRLRETELHRHTPIIMVTTSSELAVRARALDVGATAFLQKPLKAVEFLECVTQIAADSRLRGLQRPPSSMQPAMQPAV